MQWRKHRDRIQTNLNAFVFTTNDIKGRLSSIRKCELRGSCLFEALILLPGGIGLSIGILMLQESRVLPEIQQHVLALHRSRDCCDHDASYARVCHRQVNRQNIRRQLRF